jgi:uncharacterized membrane protein YphA (DoxX/SURF4 family)
MSFASRNPAGRPQALALAAVLARWGLGFWFIYLGLTKAAHPVDFLKLVRQYQMVASPVLLNSITAFLPWFEVFCGILLVAGIAVRGTALASFSLLVTFTLIVLKRALAIAATQGLHFCAVKFDCGCGTGEVLICHKLLENGLLILLSAWLTAWPTGLLCLRFTVRTHSAASQ